MKRLLEVLRKCLALNWSTRGYPVSDFDQRAADISVNHPRVVEKDKATTEDLRTAMIHYRSLFEDLVQAPASVERKEVA